MLKSASQALSGLGKMRLGSLVTGVGSAAALIGIHAPANLKEALGVAAGAVLGAVNVGDSIVRAAHLKALPALINKDATAVEQDTSNPVVDSLAEKLEVLAARVVGLENRPTAPSVADIIAGLTGKPATVAPAPAVATPAPVADPEPAPTPAAAAEVVSTPTPAHGA